MITTITTMTTNTITTMTTTISTNTITTMTTTKDYRKPVSLPNRRVAFFEPSLENASCQNLGVGPMKTPLRQHQL